ncbi:hypothetical protein MMC20_006345 [Loxospora ochrophaea]|nr:hypothetical protein [Loxospora ochrophaea]
MTSRHSQTLPASVPDNQLGLSSSEVHILRQHQAIALAPPQHHSSSLYSASSRGRSHARNSASSSRAASAASSGHSAAGNGRLVMDPGSLAVLGQHFDRVMASIQGRVDTLTYQTQRATTAQSHRAASSLAAADAEIARVKDMIRQIDELETEFDKVRHIRDIVKGFRARVEGLERRVDRVKPAWR